MSRFQCFIFFENVNKGQIKMVNVSHKNGQILHCHFNKIIKEPGTSFQSPAFSQKYVRNVCHTAHQYLTKFHFDST